MAQSDVIPRSLSYVDVGTRRLADFRTTLVPGMYEDILARASSLAGARVLHLSATAFGGGVAEIMYTLMPLMRDVGLEPTWGIIHGADEFFDVTKLLHNTLQGDPTVLSASQRATFRTYQEINAGLFDPDDYDIVFVHDPQPVGLARLHASSSAKWAWRCHIDVSTPNPDTLEFLLPDINAYPAAFFHRTEYVPPAYVGDARIVPPAIDPLNPKNMALSLHDAHYILDQFGIDTTRPLITQISRFDPWKDPMGVIDAWRLVRDVDPTVQLALVGSMADDDPEGQEFWDLTAAHAAGDPDIHLLSNLDGVGAVEVNAFQVASNVVLQKSIKEGFGLTVSEALWKCKPVVAGDVGGIRSQITDGHTGYLVSSVEECGQRCIELLGDATAAEHMARAGKEHVREHFLTPRLLRDHLTLYNDLLGRS